MTTTPTQTPEPPVDHWAVVEADLNYIKSLWVLETLPYASLRLNSAIASLATLRQNTAPAVQQSLAGDAGARMEIGIDRGSDGGDETCICLYLNGETLIIQDPFASALAPLLDCHARPPAHVPTDAGGRDGV